MKNPARSTAAPSPIATVKQVDDQLDMSSTTKSKQRVDKGSEKIEKRQEKEKKGRVKEKSGHKETGEEVVNVQKREPQVEENPPIVDPIEKRDKLVEKSSEPPEFSDRREKRGGRAERRERGRGRGSERKEDKLPQEVEDSQPLPEVDDHKIENRPGRGRSGRSERGGRTARGRGRRDVDVSNEERLVSDVIDRGEPNSYTMEPPSRGGRGTGRTSRGRGRGRTGIGKAPDIQNDAHYSMYQGDDGSYDPRNDYSHQGYYDQYGQYASPMMQSGYESQHYHQSPHGYGTYDDSRYDSQDYDPSYYQSAQDYQMGYPPSPPQHPSSSHRGGYSYQY